MVVAEIDIAQSIELKMMHDIVGHYNRFDIFHLEVDPTPNQPVRIKKPTRRDEQTSDESPQGPQDETSKSANLGPVAVGRAKAQ
jgi:nitrilase